MPPKRQLSFADLGLSTPLPDTLTKTKTQRRTEQLQLKKVKKERVQECIEQVAQSRTVVEQHKKLLEKEAAKEKQSKLQRKRELQIEHLRVRSERHAAERQRDEISRISQREYLSRVLEEKQVQDSRAKEIQALIEKEQQEKAKIAPRSVHIDIRRDDVIVAQRAGLPVLREEQPIMEAINGSSRSCVLLCGETGSGKTTQVPQFLWEAGYGHPEGSSFGREGAILVTEPRRVAAVSMARRVAEELGVGFGDEVCYHVRYDNNLSENFKLKFATEGIVLKEIQSDFLLSKYSAIIVDEAHERSISCDILIGLLSRIVPLRNDLHQEELRSNGGVVSQTKVKPLKLVIMSATMRVTDFKDNATLFPITPSLISVEVRRFPVSNHYARKTELKEYVRQTFDKVRDIHKKLPPGGILVFLCTQQEIEDLCGQLRKHYAKTKIEYYDDSYSKHSLLVQKSGEDALSSDAEGGEDRQDAGERDEFGLSVGDYALEEEADAANTGLCTGGKRTRDITNNADACDEASALELGESEVNGEFNTLHVLPLYALLDFQKQQQVFQPPPKGTRLCVVATNVAETSITIPNIRYVVDAGRVKSKVIDPDTKASCFRIGWTSQASAEQRSGRAGRMGPGHCYRLFSTAVYSNVMPKHSDPEVLRTPLDAVVLLMKHIGIENVGSFPFPSAPREEDMRSALQHLSAIGALDPHKNLSITSLGRQLVAYPVPPRFARAVVEALARGCAARILERVIAIVAVASTTTTVFTGEGNRLKSIKKDESSDVRRENICLLMNPGSDLITYLNAFLVYVNRRENCFSYCLVQKSMYESKLLAHQLRRLAQETHDADEVVDSLDVNETWTLTSDPADTSDGGQSEGNFRMPLEEEMLLRKLFIVGLLDQVARRATVHECRSAGVEYNDKKTSRVPYLITSTRTIAYIHPTSTVSRTFPPPEYLTFAFLQSVRRSETKTAQTTMLGVTVVMREWLLDYGYVEE